MCDTCDARRADPRWKAFREQGMLEVLLKTELAKSEHGKPAYIFCTPVEDERAADVRAAAMVLTDETVQAARCRPVLICLN